jgi:deoxyadenosine/deoxycytidine kinase
MSKIVTVDGNIGAGKTTVLQALHRQGFDVKLEPVDKWQPWLDRMYKSDTGVFELQIRVWLDSALPKKIENTTFIERSPMFQAGVFVPANVANGRLTTVQAALLDEMYEKIWEPTHYIYLRSDPNKCSERIKNRGRRSEDSIPLEYLRSLHDLHETVALTKGKVIIIDVEGRTIEQISNEILCKISE